MIVKKLNLNDFEVISTKLLLETKGGDRPHVFHSRHVLQEGEGGGGGGGANGCPKCKEAYENEGTAIPRRCNGSSHFSGSIAAAWDKFWSIDNAIVTGSTASPYAPIGAAGVGYMNDPGQQFRDYYKNYNASGGSSQSVSAPSRAQILTAMNTCQ